MVKKNSLYYVQGEKKGLSALAPRYKRATTTTATFTLIRVRAFFAGLFIARNIIRPHRRTFMRSGLNLLNAFGYRLTYNTPSDGTTAWSTSCSLFSQRDY